MISSKHVVLALLRERRGYGYDLMQRLQTPRFAWANLAGTVYQALDRLEREGLVEVVDHWPGSSRRSPPKPIYALTPAGNEDLARWLAEPCELDSAREDICVKLVLTVPFDWEQVLAMAASLTAACLRAMTELQASENPALDELGAGRNDPPDRVVAAVFVEEAEMSRLRGLMGWLDRLRVYAQARLDAQGRIADAPDAG